MKNSNKYLEAIEKNICSVCVDSDDNGICSLTEKEICGVKHYFDNILEIVHNSNTDDTYELHAQLRDQICESCKTSIDKDHCNLRDDSNCALDRYFSVIVETIQKVDRGLIS
jgi:hypothetical protein